MNYPSIIGILFFISLSGLALPPPKEVFNLPNKKGWKKEWKRNRFTLYSRQADSKNVEVRIVGTLKASLPSLMGNLRDVESSIKWIPDLEEKYTLGKSTDLEAVTYSLTGMPWPLFDRYLILHNKLWIDREKKLLIVYSRSIPHSKAPRPKKAIEAHLGYSFVTLRPEGKEKTRVEFLAMVDPKGTIPTWIVNFFQKKWPYKFLLSLERYAQKHAPPLLPGLEKALYEFLQLMSLPKDYFKDLRKKTSHSPS